MSCFCLQHGAVSAKTGAKCSSLVVRVTSQMAEFYIIWRRVLISTKLVFKLFEPSSHVTYLRIIDIKGGRAIYVVGTSYRPAQELTFVAH